MEAPARSRSQNSSLILDHVKHYSVTAKRKLTNTKPSAEPHSISQYKSILKTTKNLTPELEQIANNLYLSQIEQSTILRTLSNKLTNIPIQDSSDRFGIFLNNMGIVYQKTQDIYDMHLINIKDELINPLHEFNSNHIEQCQASKLQLKTIKTQYDITKNKDDKIKKLLDERYPSTPAVKPKKKRSKSIAELKSDVLENTRNEFINSVIIMMGKGMQLMQSMQHYMCSFEAYSTIHSQNIESQKENMANSLLIEYDWSKNVMVVKDGYFKKQGNRRYFKLFKNKKMLFMTGLGINGTIKGYIDLNKIFDICKKDTDVIEIQTLRKKEVFQFDTMGDRDEWFEMMQETVANKKVSISQAKKSFEQIFSDDQISIGSDEMLGNNTNI